MKKPNIEDYKLDAGATVHECTVASNRYQDEQKKYIDQLEAENKELKEKLERVEDKTNELITDIALTNQEHTPMLTDEYILNKLEELKGK